MLPRDWHRSSVGLVDDMIMTLKSIKMRLIHIYEISERCVRIAVPVSQLIWTPVDFDPRSISSSRYGLPGPNLLRSFSRQFSLFLADNRY